MLQFIILVQLYLCFSLNKLQDFLFMSSFLFFLNVFPHFWSCALKARYAFFPPSIWPACGECAWLPLTDTEASILRRIGGSRICRGPSKPSETHHCSGFVAINRPSLFRLFTAVVTGWSQMWTCHVGRPGFVIYHLWSVMKGRSFRGKCCKCFLIARKVERNQTRKSSYLAKQSPFFLKAQRDFVLKPCCKKHRLGSCVNGSRDRYSGESVSPICLLET